MNIIRLLATIAFVFSFFSVQANTVLIKGVTRADVTYKPIPFVSIVVMDKDSVVLTTGMSSSETALNACQFSIDKIPLRDSYILEFSCVGYKTTFVPLSLKKNQTHIDMGNVLLGVSYEQLNDVVVSSTKIKMVVDKDTIIYNANAFQLSKGSMLDNLVKQLPGVELNDNGQITVNGRFVSSLLLNGKDFFKGDPKVALENLPAYMVNKVKVYDKERDDAYLSKNKADIDKELVMDVNLKLQYSIGFIANAEAGYGSKDRYLGRLFGLRFTDHSRLSFYANANNLNQKQKPGNSGNWDSQWTPGGRTDMKTAGFDLQIDDRKGIYKLNSSLIAKLEDVDNQILSSGVMFLTDYDRYTFGRNSSKNKNTSLTTDHELIVKKPGLWSKFTLSAGYTHGNNKGLSQGAEFREKPIEAHRGKVLDSLFSPYQYISLASALVNSYQEKSQNKTDQYDAKLYGYVSLSYIKVVVNATYNNRTSKEFSKYGVNYDQETTDFRNRYIDIPSELFSYDIEASRLFDLPDDWEDFSIGISYAFVGKHQSGDKSLYRLDEYDRWNSFTGNPLGNLPSTRDSLYQVMDLKNSYFSKGQNRIHKPELSFSYTLPTKGQSFISLRFPLNIEYDELSYRRALIDTTLNRNTVLFEPSFVFSRSQYTEKTNNRIDFVYSFIQSAPSLISILDIKDDSNPLFIQSGNSGLRNQKSHKFNFIQSDSRQVKQRNIGINLDGEILLDAIGQSITYDETTGVRTYIPKNINGNWNIGGNFSFSQAVDKNRNWQFSTATGMRFINSVDWISLTNTENSIKSTVKNLNLSEALKFDYRKGEIHVGANVRAKWTHATSDRENFNTINSIDLNYGLLAVLPLPLKFKLSTDLTLYTRNGYTYETMNTEDFVWNATVSRSLLHGNMTLSIDGFDILGQLSNVRQSLSAQGHTETWFNSIPQYAMFRVIYRLNKEPKK